MKKIGNEYTNSVFENIKHIDEFGNEFWYARELSKVLEYKDWRNFKKVIDKAVISAENSISCKNVWVVEVNKSIKTGKGKEEIIKDYKLSRYICYLIIQNADPSKEVVALGQTYFAIQTRKQEITEQEYDTLSDDEKRFYQRNFTTNALNKVWDTDVTYLIFKGSRAYLSTIIDLYDRHVVAYKISKHNDNKLVMDTLNEALKKEKDIHGLILHSDQGFQYTSYEYKTICELNGITISMARKGTPIDDSPIEGWHSLLKKETLYNNNITSLQEYIQLVEEWILFYNTTRLKSKIKKKRKTYTKREK